MTMTATTTTTTTATIVVDIDGGIGRCYDDGNTYGDETIATVSTMRKPKRIILNNPSSSSSVSSVSSSSPCRRRRRSRRGRRRTSPSGTESHPATKASITSTGTATESFFQNIIRGIPCLNNGSNKEGSNEKKYQQLSSFSSSSSSNNHRMQVLAGACILASKFFVADSFSVQYALAVALTVLSAAAIGLGLVFRQSNKEKTRAAVKAAIPSRATTKANKKNSNKYAHVKSIMFMSAASAIHLGGFEIARGASFALFTSSRTGFSSPSASPLSTVCMAPFSLGLFWFYTKCLDRYGPHKSLRLSTVTFAVLLAICGWVLYFIDPHLSVESDAEMSNYHTDRYNNDQQDYYNVSSIGRCHGNINDDDDDYDYNYCNFSEEPRRMQYYYVWKRLAQSTTFFLYVASSAFFQLLYTQHWSFLGSVIGLVGGNNSNNNDDEDGSNDRKSQNSPSSSEGTMWFAPIAGLGSVSSTVAGLCLPYFLERFGLTGSLSVAAGVLLLSGAFADRAYRIALQNGFEPGHFHDHKTKTQNGSKKKNDDDNVQDDSLIQASAKLFKRVPVLASLSLEVLASQSVSSIIHFLFVLEVQQSIPDDTHRASWTGHCYAWMNACSGVLQFLGLPLLMRLWNPAKKQDGGDESSQTSRWQQRFFWLTMPISMMICSALLVYCNNEKALSLVTVTFALNKVLEWSVRGVAMETLYSSLDYESQFLGKELISMVVDRVGRSSTAVALSFVTSIFGLSPALDKGFVHALSVSSLLWFMTSYPLSKHCPSHQKREKK